MDCATITSTTIACNCITSTDVFLLYFFFFCCVQFGFIYLQVLDLNFFSTGVVKTSNMVKIKYNFICFKTRLALCVLCYSQFDIFLLPN